MLEKPKKRARNRGRSEWLKARRQWVKSNPPNHQGYWECGICGRWVHEDEMELDHIEKRGSHPEKVFEQENLRPTHPLCNQEREL